MADPSPTASLLTFVLGAVTLAPGARVKLRSDQQAEFDSRLHSHRVKTYCELWTLMEPLARYDREGTLDEKWLLEISVALRTCYFIKGGIFLTDASRDAYFALKDRLQIAISITGERPHADLEAINPDEFKRLRDCGSALRTSTCTDLRSRKQPALNAGDRLRAWMKSFKQ